MLPLYVYKLIFLTSISYLPDYECFLLPSFVDRGIDLSRWRELLKEKGVVAELENFVHHVHGNHFIPNTVLVDCTADSVIASYYRDWLRKGIHVVTPNKKANSGPLDQVMSHFFCESSFDTIKMSRNF